MEVAGGILPYLSVAGSGSRLVPPTLEMDPWIPAMFTTIQGKTWWTSLSTPQIRLRSTPPLLLHHISFSPLSPLWSFGDHASFFSAAHTWLCQIVDFLDRGAAALHTFAVHLIYNHDGQASTAGIGATAGCLLVDRNLEPGKSPT